MCGWWGGGGGGGGVHATQFHGWSGCLGELRGCLSTTELITNLNFYWLSGSTTSSLRFYKESLTSNRVWASLFSKVRRNS